MKPKASPKKICTKIPFISPKKNETTMNASIISSNSLGI